MRTGVLLLALATLGVSHSVRADQVTPGPTTTLSASALTGSVLAPGITTSSLTSAAGGSFGTAAYTATGTSGATIPLNNGSNVFSVASLNGWAPRWAARDDSASAAVTAGSGYNPGDTITLNDGCATHTVIVLGTTQASNSGVTANTFNIGTHGVCLAIPSNASTLAQLSTSGTGSGAVFSLLYGPIAATVDVSGNVTINNGNIIISSAGAFQNFAGSEAAIFGVHNGQYISAGAYLTVFGSFAANASACAAPAVLQEVIAIGTDSLRNGCGESAVLSIGFAALRNYAQVGTVANLYLYGTTAVGNGAMTNWNSPTAAPYNTALGNNAAAGAATGTVSFTNVTALGAGTVPNLTTAVNILAVGGGYTGAQIGPTCASGNGVVLIGSGRYVVDCPAAGTSGYLNIENIITNSITNSPALSTTYIAGNLTALGGTLTAGVDNSVPGILYLAGSSTSFAQLTGGTNGVLTSSSILQTTNQVYFGGLTADTGHADSTVCETTGNGQLFFGSGTGGICLTTSSARFKSNVLDQTEGLKQIMALRPVAFNYRAGHGFDPAKRYNGFLAEEMEAALPNLVGHDDAGLANSVDMMGLVPVMARAIQQQQREIAALRASRH
jgi:hypothetical protein